MTRRKVTRANRNPRTRTVEVRLGGLEDTIEPYLTPEVLAQDRVIADLADQGELRLAFDLVCRTPHIPGGGMHRALTLILDSEPEIPPWAWGRFIVTRAYLWAMTNEDPRIDTIIRESMLGLHSKEFEKIADRYRDEAELLQAIRVLGTKIGACDPFVEDAALFDRGVLADYLQERAGERLLAGCPTITEWPGWWPSVYRVEDSSEDNSYVLTDLRTGGEIEAHRDLEHRDFGPLLLGRLVPVPGGSMFALQPLAVHPKGVDDMLNGIRSGYRGRLICLARDYPD